MYFFLERGKRFFGAGVLAVCLVVFGVRAARSFEHKSTGEADDPYRIETLDHLNQVRNNLSAHYILMNDIDASDTENWNGGKGWDPIGREPDYFSGKFDGGGHTISGLFIDRDAEDFVGLFARLDWEDSEISDVHLRNVQIAGGDHTGGLVAHTYGNTSDSTSAGIINSSVSGIVTGKNWVGGIVGTQSHSVIEASSFSGSVDGFDLVGGLAGETFKSTSEIINSHAEGSVEGNEYVGGLVGWANDGTIITASYSSVNVSGARKIGGLAGGICDSVITNSRATGTVAGTGLGIGGLVGELWINAIVADSYASGNINAPEASEVGGFAGYIRGQVNNSYSTGTVNGGDNYSGGFAGNVHSGGTVSFSYSVGSVTGSNDVGGFVGINYGKITNSFWNTETSKMDASDGGGGKTTAEMQDISTFEAAGWSIEERDADLNDGYPYLAWELSGNSPVWYIHDGSAPAPSPSPSPAPEPESAYPAPPAGFTVEPRDGFILSNHVTWIESSSEPVSSYRLYVSTGESTGTMGEARAEGFEFRLLGEFSPDTFEYTHTGLSGIRYYYVITSVNEEDLESNVTSPVYWANPATGEYGWLDALAWPGNVVEKPDDGGSSCFIATAAYGSAFASEVTAFRNFRDGFLLSNRAGSRLVEAYYAASPVFAGAIAESGILRKVARLHLAPFGKFAGVLTNMN